MSCPRCSATHIVKNGHTPMGKQNYRCQVCGRQFVADPASRAHSPTLRRCVLSALNERISLRGAERVFKVSRQTIARWLEEAAAEVEDEFMRVLPPNTLLTLEMDEVWSFISQKKNPSWLWVALDRATRRVVAWVCGDRSETTAWRLCEALPEIYRVHSQIFTDFWSAYSAILPEEPHSACGKDSGETSHIERLNNTLR
jgi:insertion element IS1 protein InsB